MTTFNLKDDTVGGAVDNSQMAAMTSKQPVEDGGVEQVEGDMGHQASQKQGQASVQDGKGKQVIKEIMLKGPLSHAYTEALNLLLNKKSGEPEAVRLESIQQTLLIMDQESEEEEALNHPVKKEYVYVYDGKTMNLGDVTNLVDQVLATQEDPVKNGYTYAVVENADQFMHKHPESRAMDTLVYHAEKAGTTVFFSKEALYRHIGVKE